MLRRGLFFTHVTFLLIEGFLDNAKYKHTHTHVGIVVVDEVGFLPVK